jgi:hypothetical protein
MQHAFHIEAGTTDMSPDMVLGPAETYFPGMHCRPRTINNTSAVSVCWLMRAPGAFAARIVSDKSAINPNGGP